MTPADQVKQVEETKQSKLPPYYWAVGRRKESHARVRCYVLSAESDVKFGTVSVKRGDIVVNGRPIEKYFSGEISKKLYLEPFRTTNTLGRFAVTIQVLGGGINGQLEATVHGISRALEKVDKEKFRPILKKKGFLTRDPRAKERRKAGYAHKARAKRQSPKR